jgi:hypothetical protein
VLPYNAVSVVAKESNKSLPRSRRQFNRSLVSLSVRYTAGPRTS